MGHQFNCILLFIPLHKCLACRFNLFFGWPVCTGQMDTVIFMIIPIYFTESIRWFWPYGHQCNCISLYIEYHICLALNVHYVLVEQTTHGKKVTFKMITNILLKFTKVIMASFGNQVNYTSLNTPKHKSPFLNVQNFNGWTRHTSWKGNIQD